jgi:hypothetical protein
VRTATQILSGRRAATAATAAVLAMGVAGCDRRPDEPMPVAAEQPAAAAAPAALLRLETCGCTRDNRRQILQIINGTEVCTPLANVPCW